MTLLIAALVVCIALSAFFSASEISLTAASRVRLENLAEGGNRRAIRALKLSDAYDAALSAILIGNNLVNIAASSLSSVLAILISGRLGAAEGLCTTVATAAVTLLIILFGETVPKITAKRNAVRYTLAFSGPLRALTVVLRPLVSGTVRLIALLTRSVRPEEDPDPDARVDELATIIETAEDEAVLDEDQSELMQAALDFSDISVGEVMTARVDLIAIDVDDPPEAVLAAVEAAPYTRLPVFEGDTDTIIGVLHANTYYRALLDGPVPDLRTLLTEPCRVYRTVKLPAVLELLRRRQTHLAVVTDEYGGTAGVVTMEDVLESLVGDIWDETDEVEPEVVPRADDSWELDGDMSVGDLIDLLELDEDAFDFESETVGGWTMELFADYPSPGDRIRWLRYELTVLEASDLRVERILLRRIDAAE